MNRLCLALCGCALMIMVQIADAATVTVSTANKLQEIDGFGFFGPMKTWWSSQTATDFWTSSWLDLVVDSLGLTIWRNEYYSEESGQDATWAKQKPFVQALKAKADKSSVAIKFIYTVWTPPSSMKSNGDLKNGGNLLSSSYTAFGNWLVAGVKNYADAGVTLYGLSPQNEPLFQESYNSCVYTASTYKAMVAAVGPIVHQAYPNVKIFGPEHMLFGMGKDYDYANLDPSKAVFDDPVASQHLNLWACHGYGADGKTPTASSEEATWWKNAWQRVGQATGRHMWMTETSGYGSTWDNALDYAMSIHAALYYGRLSGWVHWYGAGDIVTQTDVTAKGAVLKHYARFVRPGAQAMTVSTGADSATLLATAYLSGATFSTVLINSGATDITASINVTGLGAQVRKYQSTSSEKCVDKGMVSANAVSLPAKSVVTLVGTLSSSGVIAAFCAGAHQGPLTAYRAPGTSVARDYLTETYDLRGVKLRTDRTRTPTAGVYIVKTSGTVVKAIGEIGRR